MSKNIKGKLKEKKKRICLAKSCLQAFVWFENKSLENIYSWWEASSLSNEMFLSLWGGEPISQTRGRVGQGKDYWSVDVCCSVKCQCQSLSIEWCLPCAALLVCPSASRPSITTLGKDIFHSEQDLKQVLPPLAFGFSLCPVGFRQKHTLLWLCVCFCLWLSHKCVGLNTTHIIHSIKLSVMAQSTRTES